MIKNLFQVRRMGMTKFFLATMPFLLIIFLIVINDSDKGINTNADFSKSCVKFPVVNNTVMGRVIEACARITEGEGNIFLNINNTRIDEFKSQAAIMRAVDAAYNVSGESRADKDVMVFIDSGGTSIRGDSMGVAVCTAVLARINNLDIRDDISVTGSIIGNGRIGNVSSIRDKAMASKSYGMRAMIIPKGLRYYNGTDIEDITDIEIIETEDINEVIRELAK